MNSTSSHLPASRSRLAAAVVLAVACGGPEPVTPDVLTASPLASTAPEATATSAPGSPAPSARATGTPTPSATPSATAVEGAAVPPLHPSVDDYPETQVTLETDAGDVTIRVKVADTRPRRGHGLMEVTELPDGTGMLFVYDEPSDGSYYMLDTLVPLDIAFLDGDGRVIATFAMEPCAEEPCPRYGPDQPFVAALEVAQGWFDEVGVEPGDGVAWGDIVPAAA